MRVIDGTPHPDPLPRGEREFRHPDPLSRGEREFRFRQPIYWHILCALVIVLSGITRADGAEPVRYDPNMILRAEGKYEAGELSEAKDLFRDILEYIDAGSAPQRYNLGRSLRALLDIHQRLGEHAEAVEIGLRYREFLRARKDATGLRETSIRLAKSYLALDQPSKARELLSSALSLQGTPIHPVLKIDVLIQLARIEESLEERTEAKRHWLQAEAVALGALSPTKITALSAKDRFLCVRQLAILYSSLEDLPESEKYLRKSLEMRTDVITRADLHNELASVLYAQGKTDEAQGQWKEAEDLYRLILKKPPDRSAVTWQASKKLETIFRHAGRYEEAAKLLATRLRSLPENDPLTIDLKSDLGVLYVLIGSSEKALRLLGEVVDHRRSQNPRAPDRLFQSLANLATVQHAAGFLPEAQELCEEALELAEDQSFRSDRNLAKIYNISATILQVKGKYLRSTDYYHRGIEICRQLGEESRDLLSTMLLNLALVYKSQGQYAVAEQFCLESRQIHIEKFGSDSFGLAAHHNALAALYFAQQKLAAAHRSAQRAWEICTVHGKTQDPIAASTRHQLALVCKRLGDYDSAQKHWLAVLSIQDHSGQSAEIARTLNHLARLAQIRGNPIGAETLYRQALSVQDDRLQVYPINRFITLSNLAEVLYSKGQKQEARFLLDRAVELAEEPRTQITGAERQRAEFFAQFGSAFDLLVDWNLEEGKSADAFSVAERGRNRTFLDQLRLAGIDPREGLRGTAAEHLLEEERRLNGKVNALRVRARDLSSRSDMKEKLEQVLGTLDEAQRDFENTWTEIMGASRIYRELLKNQEPLALAKVRDRVLGPKDMMLFYYLGNQHSHLWLIGPDSSDTEVFELEIPQHAALDSRLWTLNSGPSWRPDPAAAQRAPGKMIASPKGDLLPPEGKHTTPPRPLRIGGDGGMTLEKGPLTRKLAAELVARYMSEIYDREDEPVRAPGGIVVSKKKRLVSDGPALLTEVFLPIAVRSRIRALDPELLVIVPDGALHQLPFEALVLGNDRFVVDEMPPIAYAPSATILAKLLERPSPDMSVPSTVLTVGNPAYTKAPSVAGSRSRGMRSKLNFTLEAFLGLGGRLALLPGSSEECRRISRAFGPGHFLFLEGLEATEPNVVQAIAGHRFIHLAAHGLLDEHYDNLFGAIALTPPSSMTDSAEDDGFLSLHEICSLDLDGCELAVLSACQTNVGADRPLEAGSSLARAFLTGGAKRVIASHWNVADASTSELIGTFFEEIARSCRRGQDIDYASALQKARQKIRGIPKWSSPYHWAPFVLLGPAR